MDKSLAGSCNIITSVKKKGVGVLKFEINPGSDWQLLEVRLHMLAVGGATENLTITVDSKDGSDYNCILDTEAMAAVANYVYAPTTLFGNLLFKEDKVVIDYANINGVAWGIEVIYGQA
jgi:hypothetical protein